MKAGMKEVQLYPDASGFHLRNALAKLEGVTFDEIVLGNGSNEVIELLIRTFCVPGDLMVASDGVFAAFQYLGNQFTGGQDKRIRPRQQGLEEPV